MDAYKVIIEPVLTEKSNFLRDGETKKYVFKVDKKVNKIQVIEAVKDIFSVNPVSCNIVNVRGKKKANVPISAASFIRGYGKTSSWKKAIVTLAAGEKIDAFEGV
ncbi:50S ribosomal protein L23 [Oceanispirochaeta sp.]|jgi:large subunit ribosomal protein L23|uniref:50S ribosomal protein L23 n=1 Tax=Oceanispirochaeta sp. TaxID=2035350 RepID=UPI0026085009|nr:50S ribosomal protein L23 [Oceanispirochaeta sp.]MDA3958460.1 50S ribosomal protein L23 [Oceanispirochaeta sp.]